MESEMIYLFILTLFIAIPMIQAVSVEDLRYELTEWIRIGIGDDIIRMPDNRKEYAPLVEQVNEKYKDRKLENEQKVNYVLGLIEEECRVPRLKRVKRPIFWHLIFLKVKSIMKLKRF